MWLLSGVGLLVVVLAEAEAIRWLALGSADADVRLSSAWCRGGAARGAGRWGLTGRQVALLCRGALDALDAVPLVSRASQLATSTCQQLFAARRWNCSSLGTAPALSPDLTTGTREQAYAYALSSAAVTHAVARACAQGALVRCSCSAPPRDPPNGNFKWGGCGDNVRYAAAFTRQFTDAAEKRREQQHYAVTDARRSRRVHQDGVKRSGGGGIGRAQLALVNLHNNRAGRRAVEASEVTQCKCHGVSGSCNIKTCWRALPRLGDIGQRLQRRFSTAAEVAARPMGPMGRRRLVPLAKPYGQDDLIFLTKSPDYCIADPRTGSRGTLGRSCNASSNGLDSCRDMCCGRGYRTVLLELAERCQCKYYWCCYVRCKTCTSWVDVHQCL